MLTQSYFSVNLEEPSVYTEPEPQPEKVTVPRKVTPEPYKPKPSAPPKTVPVEPKVAPQKPATPELKVPKMKPEPEAPKVEPAKKKPEAPKARGKVVQLKRRCVIENVSHVAVVHTHNSLMNVLYVRHY